MINKYFILFLTIFTCNFLFATPLAEIKTTEGSFTIKLYADKAPVTVRNFITLCRKNFFNDIIFHRVIKDFMIQTGDPTGTGRGGPGYTFQDEINNELKHNKAGIVSMANRGPDTNGSQFFITLSSQSHLDGKHTVFGEITDGLKVVKKIGKTKTDINDKPINPIKILSITITGDSENLLSSNILEETKKRVLPLIEENIKLLQNEEIAKIDLNNIKKNGDKLLIIWNIETKNQTKALFSIIGTENQYGISIIETHFNIEHNTNS